MASIDSIADALVAALIAAGFAEAEIRPLPYTEREDCAARKCVVMCRNMQYPDGHRGDFDEIAELAIVLQKAITSTDTDALRSCLDDTQTLIRLWGESGVLRAAVLAGADYEEGPEHPTGNLYEPEILNDLQLYQSVMVVRYRLEAA